MAMPPMMSAQNPAASTAPAPAPVRPPLMGAQNATPPVLPPALNPQGNRLDSLMAQAGAVTGRGEPTSMPEDLAMSGDPMMGEEEGMMPQDVAVGVAEAVVSNTANLEDALTTLDMAREQILSQMDSGPAMGGDEGRLEELLGGLPV